MYFMYVQIHSRSSTHAIHVHTHACMFVYALFGKISRHLQGAFGMVCISRMYKHTHVLQCTLFMYIHMHACSSMSSSMKYPLICKSLSTWYVCMYVCMFFNVLFGEISPQHCRGLSTWYVCMYMCMYVCMYVLLRPLR
jgi:hypothetical protein